MCEHWHWCQPEGRINYLHLNVQKAAEAHVASHCGLTKGMDEKVAELLKNNVFIYPLNSKIIQTRLSFQ